MKKILEKWSPIMDTLKITDEEKRKKMSIYAEHHSKLENKYENSQSLLPISLKILDKLNNFEITDDSSEIKDFRISAKFSHSDAMEMALQDVDWVPMAEDLLIKEFVDYFKDKDASFYTVVSSISVISESNFDPKLTLTTRVKINEEDEWEEFDL